MKNDKMGKFITFEGPEGAGKSTQIKMLAEYLTTLNQKVVLTREPGGTPLAEELRSVVKHHNKEIITPVSELLLLTAARSQHVAGLIRPALQRGEWVLCDRFADSTTAYQGGARAMDMELINTLYKYTVEECVPNLTIILDLPVEAGFKRTALREETLGAFDRFESQKIEFHHKVRSEFLAIAKREPNRVKVVNAEDEPSQIHLKIRSLVDELL